MVNFEQFKRAADKELYRLNDLAGAFFKDPGRYTA